MNIKEFYFDSTFDLLMYDPVSRGGDISPNFITYTLENSKSVLITIDFTKLKDHSKKSYLVIFPHLNCTAFLYSQVTITFEKIDGDLNRLKIVPNKNNLPPVFIDLNHKTSIDLSCMFKENCDPEFVIPLEGNENAKGTIRVYLN